MLFVVSSACGRGQSLAPAPARPSEARRQAAEPAQPAPASAEPKADSTPAGKGYDVELEQAGAARVGQPHEVLVRVTPRQPWHLNLDFPTSLELRRPEDVEAAKNTLDKADARTFHDEGAEFVVSMTPRVPGNKSLDAVLSFAVCSEDSCVPVREQFAIEVVVE